MQLVGNRELAGNEILEQPCLPASELVSFQNYAGLRGWTRTGRPYPSFHGIRKPSTCGFDFTDCGMPGGSRPSLVNRHGFEIAGSAGARLAPDNGPGAGRMAVGRMAARAVEAKNGGTRDVLGAPGRRAAATPPPAGRDPRAGSGIAGPSLSIPSRILAAARKIFSEIVLASAGEFPYSTSSHGGVAQLGERLTGSQEVRGSIPLVSTIVNAKAFGFPKAFFMPKYLALQTHPHQQKVAQFISHVCTLFVRQTRLSV